MARKRRSHYESDQVVGTVLAVSLRTDQNNVLAVFSVASNVIAELEPDSISILYTKILTKV
jgi:hypothetical protein